MDSFWVRQHLPIAGFDRDTLYISILLSRFIYLSFYQDLSIYPSIKIYIIYPSIKIYLCIYLFACLSFYLCMNLDVCWHPASPQGSHAEGKGQSCTRNIQQVNSNSILRFFLGITYLRIYQNLIFHHTAI